MATSSDVHGLVAQGRTIRETVEIAEDVAKKIFESCIEHNDFVPVTLQSLADNTMLDFSVVMC